MITLAADKLVSTLREIGYDNGQMVNIAFSLSEKGIYDSNTLCITHGDDRKSFKLQYK